MQKVSHKAKSGKVASVSSRPKPHQEALAPCQTPNWKPLSSTPEQQPAPHLNAANRYFRQHLITSPLPT